MRNLFGLLFLLTPLIVSGQNNTNYKSIDSLGWNATNFEVPHTVHERDSGKVVYLLTLTRKGEVKTVKVLSNTFNPKTEAAWRAMVNDLIFTRKNTSSRKQKYKGTFLIESYACFQEI